MVGLLALLLASDVLLHWTANPEPYGAECKETNTVDLKGYKVHRGAATRAYDMSVDVGNVTTYTMVGVANGSWFFAVTAYDACGNESGFSNEVVKVIPATTPPTPANLRIE